MKKKVVKKKKSKKINHTIQTEYLGRVYSNKFLTLVPKAVKRIRSYRRQRPFDAIAFTGSSGAALAFPLSYFLKVPLIHVRKDKGHYSQGPIEGTVSSKRYLIVDDLIESGNTIRRIIKNVKKKLGADTRPVGICLYGSDRNPRYMPKFNFDGKPIPIFLIPE